MIDKARVKELYVKGHNAVEIARLTNNKIDAVRKCIQRNFEHLKYSHEVALTQRREEIRAVNYGSKRYLSDKAFILKNRSIYKTLPNGDIVLDNEVAGTVTWDTPRRLVNENKSIV
nr:DNA-binding response regulator [Clostridium sp. YIM B02506]